MSHEPTNKKKDELYQLLADVEKKAPSLEKLGQDLTRAARNSRDLAACFRDVVRNIPSDDLLDEERWRRTIDGWKDWHSLASDVERSRSLVSSFSVTATGATVSATSMMHELGPVPPFLEPFMLTAKTKLAQIIELPPLADDVRKSMKRLRLDTRTEVYQTALQLFDQAKGAFDQPTDSGKGAVSVFIPLRECINVALDDLLKRRPQQEPARKPRNKIISIGAQCGRAHLQLPYFERLGADADDLLDRLSGTKQASMTREKIIELFREGLLFLKAFLESIDENRLRPI
jgi:hypothetical protein